jgi:hypothetical protein
MVNIHRLSTSAIGVKMLSSRTVFIVGAGGSYEWNMPVGDQLRTLISEALDIRYSDGFRMDGRGDREIENALRHLNDNINLYLHECWKIRDGIILGHSIDNFIDAHRDNAKVQLLGKLGIVKCILKAERESKLYFDPNEANANIDFREIQNTYLVKLWRILQEGVPIVEVDRIFDNCAIITFNYDRGIEHFFYHALQAYYYVPPEKAAQLVRKLNIHHAYGTVGNLPWQSQADSTPFGKGDGFPGIVGQRLLDLASQIRTYTEQVEDNDELAALRNEIQEAHTVVFLGFAYFKENLRLLNPGTDTQTKQVYGTAFGMSAAATEWVYKQLSRMFGPFVSKSEQLKLHRELTCSGLIDEYARQLSA